MGGECDKNPSFMHTACKLSCHKCDPPKNWRLAADVAATSRAARGGEAPDSRRGAGGGASGLQGLQGGQTPRELEPAAGGRAAVAREPPKRSVDDATGGGTEAAGAAEETISDARDAAGAAGGRRAGGHVAAVRALASEAQPTRDDGRPRRERGGPSGGRARGIKALRRRVPREADEVNPEAEAEDAAADEAAGRHAKRRTRGAARKRKAGRGRLKGGDAGEDSDDEIDAPPEMRDREAASSAAPSSALRQGLMLVWGGSLLFAALLFLRMLLRSKACRKQPTQQSRLSHIIRT